MLLLFLENFQRIYLVEHESEKSLVSRLRRLFLGLYTRDARRRKSTKMDGHQGCIPENVPDKLMPPPISRLSVWFSKDIPRLRNILQLSRTGSFKYNYIHVLAIKNFTSVLIFKKIENLDNDKIYEQKCQLHG